MPNQSVVAVQFYSFRQQITITTIRQLEGQEMRPQAVWAIFSFYNWNFNIPIRVGHHLHIQLITINTAYTQCRCCCWTIILHLMAMAIFNCNKQESRKPLKGSAHRLLTDHWQIRRVLSRVRPYGVIRTSGFILLLLFNIEWLNNLTSWVNIGYCVIMIIRESHHRSTQYSTIP